MKTFTPAQPDSRSSVGSSAILPCVPPMKNAKSECIRPVARAILLAKVSRVVVSGLVLGISKDAGHAAHYRRQRAGGQILFVLEARLAEMHLGVDDARQDVEPGAVGERVGGVGAQVAQRGDAAVANADVGRVRAVLVDTDAVLEDRIVVRHVSDLDLEPRDAPQSSARHVHCSGFRAPTRRSCCSTW